MLRFLLAFILIFPLASQVMAQNRYEKELLDVANNIKLMERREGEIDAILNKLTSDRDALFETLYQRRLDATKNLHAYYSLANKPAILAYFTHEDTLYHRYFQKQYQDNINTILSRSINTDIEYFLTIEDKITAIQNFEYEQDMLSQTLTSGLNYLAEHTPTETDAELDIVVSDLKEKSESLNDFIQNLLNIENETSFEPTKSTIQFILPATGVIQSTPNGVFITTRNNALITAPADGRVMYSGVYKPLGQIVIVNHGQNYFSVLQGLSQIFARSGLLVFQGEPIGLVSNEKTLKKQGQNTNEAMLYYELWYNKKQINPIERLSGI